MNTETKSLYCYVHNLFVMEIVHSKISKTNLSSDISGESIRIAEPYIIFKDVVFKIDEASNLKEVLEDRKGSQSMPNSNSECEICGGHKPLVRLRRTNFGFDACHECVSNIVNEIENEVEKIRSNIRYWDKSGFYVKPSTNNKETDDIERDFIEESSPVLYIIGNTLQLLTTRLENIDKVIESIEEGKTEGLKQGLICQRCESYNSTRIFGRLKMCEECLVSLQNSLTEYTEDDKAFIVSNKI